MYTNGSPLSIHDCAKLIDLPTCIKKQRWASIRPTLLIAVFGILLVLFLSNIAVAQPPSDKWQFSITPYVWIPDIDGTLSYDVPSRSGGAPAVSVGADSYLENLDLGLMLNGDARKGRWSIYTDVIYLDFSNTSSKIESIDFATLKYRLVPASMLELKRP